MMEQNKLPQWSDCELAVDEGRATSLEKFIYDYEPGDDDKAWRERLTAALTATRKEARAAAFTAIGAELCKYGANIPKVDLMARFQHVFREGEAAANDADDCTCDDLTEVQQAQGDHYDDCPRATKGDR